jgi:uncharacterized protein (DUF736 family)
MEYDNNNRGVLFRNESATPENKQPYMSGSCEVNGKEMQIAGWMQESKKTGKKFLSLRFQEPQAKEVVASNSNTTSTTDEVPF